MDGVGTIEDQARHLARKSSYGAYCVVASQRKGGEALSGGIKNRVGRKLVIAAAVAFANSVKTEFAAYVGQLASGKFVLVGLLNGIPSPSFDVVGDAASIISALDEFEPHFVQGATLYVQNSILAGASEVFHKISGPAYSSVRTPVAEMPMRLPEDAELVRFHDLGMAKSIKFAGLACLLIAALAGGWYAFDQYSLQQSKKSAANDRAKAALQGYVIARDAELNAAPKILVLAGADFIWRNHGPKKANRVGWIGKSTDCTGPTCISVYSRSPTATFAEFVKSKAEGEEPIVSLTDLQNASMVANFAGYDRVPLLDLATFKQPVDHIVDFGSRAQLLKLAGVILTFTPERILGDVNLAKQMPNMAPEIRKVGDWTATGPADTFVPTMRRMPLNLTLSKVHFSVTPDSVTFEAKGRYFLR